MDEIIVTSIKLVVLLAALVLGRYIIPWFRTKLGADKLELIGTWADTFVRAAELIFSGEKSGEEKLVYVTNLLSNKAKQLSVNISEDEIRAIIEKAVAIMKDNEQK